MLRYACAQEEVTWCSISRAKQGHVVRCFAREEVTWYSVSRAKQGHLGSDFRERKEAENGVRSTANQKTIPPQ
ncbi:hypothetical protein chiPu_0013387 [Chiloscyllium punctatum]|uniref:Uncharacterized protein n=1 Tax=Chiloscyllium punctatum TaxID=137246 RepID=A0A401SX13_CHIPU|nr:hypothetical protein [Chiloscyllium punctatum]